MKYFKYLIKALILIQVCFFIIAVSCIPGQSASSPSLTISPDSSLAITRQKTIDPMRSMNEAHRQINTGIRDSPRLEGWFDANEYFSVLTHLSMQPGYLLDYLYYNDGSKGHPHLYARRIDSKPFATLKELYGKFTANTTYHPFDYLNFVQVDGSEESFFQYVVLRIMGGQFYLWWHADYNDREIVCDHTGLEAILTRTDYGQQIPSEVKDKARQLDLAPKMELNNDQAVVRVIVFTKWGGFIEETYTISREFPHLVKDLKTQRLVPWQINLTF